MTGCGLFESIIVAIWFVSAGILVFCVHKVDQLRKKYQKLIEDFLMLQGVKPPRDAESGNVDLFW